MTTPTPPRTLLRIGVGFVVTGGLLASAAVPAKCSGGDSRGGRSVHLDEHDARVGSANSGGEVGGCCCCPHDWLLRQGRKIVARLYGSPDATRVSVMIGSMHGNEPGGVPVAKRLEAGCPEWHCHVGHSQSESGWRTKQHTSKRQQGRPQPETARTSGKPGESAVSITRPFTGIRAGDKGLHFVPRIGQARRCAHLPPARKRC